MDKMSGNLCLPDSVVKTMKGPLPLCRVELHVHLEASIRRSTCFELLKAKGLPCPGKGTFQCFEEAISVTEPQGLQHFLKAFPIMLPSIQGDLDAIKRVALEFCEDAATNGILYVEARFGPHMMLDAKAREVKPRDVVKAVLDSFKRGEELFGVKVRAILCCMTWLCSAAEILGLCQEFKNEGVVGMDIAGNECEDDNGKLFGFSAEHKTSFQEAKKLGIHRTVHAGENGPASYVKTAVEELCAERIGHGYHVLEDPEIYDQCVRNGIHFECCPTSSILTGSVPVYQAAILKHPILKFARDNINFSVNSDSTGIIGSGLDSQFQLLHSWGLNEVHFARMAINGAKASFLPENEKEKLIKDLTTLYGFN